MNTPNAETLGLFQGTGIELEYVIVDQETLDVRPICDVVLQDENGNAVLEMDRGATCWSNELALHVIETKTNGPTASLEPYVGHFQKDITAINEKLTSQGAMLLPTGMHPWMNPRKDSQLWPHEQGEIYRQFDKIFDCGGHGWTNLQSMHINLPFADDEEFRLLHRAIRLLLPIMPALSASTPMVGGELNGQLNNRLRFYATNCRKVPEVTGLVIPEDAASHEEYEDQILVPMYKAIRPYDKEGILAHEWLNARGAIARFDRNAIEIRVLDTQECPKADLMVADIITQTLEQLIDGVWSDIDRTSNWEPTDLAAVYQKVQIYAEGAWISDEDYLGFFDFPAVKGTAADLWQHLLETGDYDRREEISKFLAQGSLATRIRNVFTSKKPPREEQREVYRKLATCLAEGKLFVP